MRPALSSLPRPFIVNVVTDVSASAAVATMRLAALEGAHAHEINLPLLAVLDDAALGQVFTSTAAPAYVSCRRRAFMRVYGFDPETLPEWDDATRVERQLAALELGARAIDIELDTFDPHPAPPLGTPEAAARAGEPGPHPPAEFSELPDAIRRQQEIVARAHALGGEVIMSCHTGGPQTTASLIAIAETGAARGADLVKIVTPCDKSDHLFALLQATEMLAETLPVPFTLVGAGAAGDISRIIGVNFGSAWALGQLTWTPGGFHAQPLVAQLRETFRLIPWRSEGAT